MTGRLQGKFVLITGGTTGIGFASANLFVGQGARVAITGQSVERLARAGSALGPAATAIRCDARDITGIESLAQQISGSFGALDVLFLNAGIAPYSDLAGVTEATFDTAFAVNVKHVLFTVQRFVPLLRRGSSVIVTTSINNRIGMAKTHVYSATKAAAGSLVRTLAGELAERGIRVNALSPGPVVTEIGATTGLSEVEGRTVANMAVSKVPMRRFAAADELARAALFLASDDSSFVTGQELVADGGWTGVGG